MTPGLGRLPSVDPRNLAHPMARMLPSPLAPLPTMKSWAFSGDPLNQGETGTCTGHAGVHLIHAAPMRHRGFLDPFQLYREAVLLDEYPDNDGDATMLVDAELEAGSSGTGVAKALDKRGLLAEYLWAGVMREAVEWVLTRGPVMLGSSWHRSMFDPTPEGFVEIMPHSPVEGGHEYLLRGVDTRRGIGRCVNSWGKGWNANAAGCRPGHFLMSFETIERLFHEEGDAVSAIEKRAEKKP